MSKIPNKQRSKDRTVESKRILGNFISSRVPFGITLSISARSPLHHLKLCWWLFFRPSSLGCLSCDISFESDSRIGLGVRLYNSVKQMCSFHTPHHDEKKQSQIASATREKVELSKNYKSCSFSMQFVADRIKRRPLRCLLCLDSRQSASTKQRVAQIKNKF